MRIRYGMRGSSLFGQPQLVGVYFSHPQANVQFFCILYFCFSCKVQQQDSSSISHHILHNASWQISFAWCRATIKSEVKLEKTLTFVLIGTKTSWLFPQLKIDIKNLTNCLEQCNWILIYILLHMIHRISLYMMWLLTLFGQRNARELR